jgi:FtsP/CotA-like multicopper oxidase with cupredoxin domain
MKRRDFVKLGLLSSCMTLLSANKNEITLFPSFSKPLNIPPILEPKILKNGVKEYNLNVQEGSIDFLKNAKTKTYGVNTDFLGPTIRVERNDTIKINVKNSLKEETVLHWHGLKVSGVNDGGPNRSIKPNNTWTTQYKINQRSSMCWYHPHTHEKTGSQVFMGIAGLFIIDDQESLDIKLPKEYGVDDIPLVVQDRRFDANGQFIYKQSMHDVMMGVSGNVFLVNGVVNPFVEVGAKAVRFRLLNGSNARVYRFVFSDYRAFYQVAGDASFLPKPVKMKTLLLSSGERAEIIVDFSDIAGKEIYLGDNLGNKPLLKIKIKNENRSPFLLPKKLTTINEYRDFQYKKTREFTLDVRPGWLAINKKQMDMNRIDEKVTLGEPELWRIINPTRMPHPFHIHGCSFKILTRNSSKPYPNEEGLKDTVLIYGNEIVELAVQFDYEATKRFPYMYHCHILEHEDAGMMGQFTVSKK